MKSVDQHLEDVLSGIEAIAPLDLQLLDAHGCILSETVAAEHDLPAFDNSSMDGYAVRVSDVASARNCAAVTSAHTSPSRRENIAASGVVRARSTTTSAMVPG